jgi:ketosteroid isomerase-like protein
VTAKHNIASAKTGFAAFSCGDIEGAMMNTTDDIEWVVPGKRAKRYPSWQGGGARPLHEADGEIVHHSARALPR